MLARAAERLRAGGCPGWAPPSADREHVPGPMTDPARRSSDQEPPVPPSGGVHAARADSSRQRALSTSQPTDEALLVRSREGDRQAFRDLVERYRDDLHRFLIRFLGSRTAADDVFQETFLQVHLAADSFDHERRFRPWLFAIASNKARDHHRRTRRRAATSLDAPLHVGEGTLVDLLQADLPDPGQPVADAETRIAVKRVVDELPLHYREILLLAYFQRMSYQQIAECLAIPLGTVKSRLHAAVAHFATSWKLATEGPESPSD